MKKFFSIFITIFLLIPFSNTAYAENDDKYYRVIDNQTPFFSDVNGENLMFYLPYTYYVKVIGKSGNVAHIECFGGGNTIKIDGYTYFDNLFFDGLEVINPYLDQKVVTRSSTVLYSSISLDDPIQFIFADRFLNYYGYLKSSQDQYVYCVEYGGVIGYVKEADLYPFYIENHPNNLTFLPSTSPDAPDKPVGNKNAVIPFRIIIISCLTLAGLIALFISLKKKKSPATRDFYDDGEDE